MKKIQSAAAFFLLLLLTSGASPVSANGKEQIKAIYIPLADHYAGVNVDKEGLKQIIDLALEGGILKDAIDIDAFAVEGFSTGITEETLQKRVNDK